MEISACPKCAAAPMALAGIQDGEWLSLDSGNAVCPACGFKGPPLLFADPADHAAFRASLAAGQQD